MRSRFVIHLLSTAVAVAVLLLMLLAAPLLAQDSVAVMTATDSTFVETVPELPGSLAEFFTQYQLSIATILGSLIVFGLAHLRWFAQFGDWPRRLAMVIAAMIVTAAVKAVGGTMDASLAAFVSTGISGLVSAVTGSIPFQLAKTQPGNS